MPENTISAEEQLKTFRSLVVKMVGAKEDVSDTDLAQAINKFADDAEEADEAGEAAEEKANELKKMHDERVGELEATHKAQMNALTSHYEGKIGKLQKDFDSLTAKHASATAEAMSAKLSKFESEVNEVLDKAIKEGRMLPAERDANRVMLITADREKKHKFSDATGKEIEKTQFESLVDVINVRSKVLNFSETSQEVKPDATKAVEAARQGAPTEGTLRFAAAEKEVDATSAAMDSRTRELVAASGGKMTYGAAMIEASKEFKAAAKTKRQAA